LCATSRPATKSEALLYTSPKLPAGDHVLKVCVTGDKNAAASHPVVPADRADIYP
jgi:galactosylceramidase